ncbi:MAG: hypothetical protein ACI4UE_03705 [Candidatus Scatovivens sp.]
MNLEIDLNNSKIIDIQKSFLNNTLGKVINSGLDIGLRAALPDFIEEQIIEIKDAMLENGFKEGINKAIDSAIDIGKSALGIVTGKFENISQIQTAVKNGGIIDTASKLIDKVIDISEEKNILNSSVCNLIKKGKNTILEQISKNIEESLTSQIKSIEKLNKYCKNWNQYYTDKNFDGMEKEYKKIEKEIVNIVPIEKTIKETRIIENLHNLIKNNGKNFNISEEEIQLAKKL